MHCMVQSRVLQRTLTFSRPGRAYVYVDINGRSGTLGQQICERGRLMGDTITYRGDDQEAFEGLCRRWYSAYLRKERSHA